MKKRRWIWMASGFLLLCCLGILYIFLKQKNEAATDTADEEEEQEEVIFSLSQDDVQELSFLAEGEEVTWINEEEGWTYAGDDAFPVKDTSITSLITSISSLTSVRTLEDVENPEEYGFDEPQNEIIVKKTDGTESSITVGSKNSSTGSTYIVLDGDTSTIYTIDKDLGSTFSGGLYTYAQGEDFPSITASYITSVEVDKDENSYKIEDAVKASTGWTVEDENGKKMEADSSLVSELQSSISLLSFSGFYEYNCQDWSEYGLDDPQMILTVGYNEEVEVEVDTSDEETDEASAEAAENEDESDADNAETADSEESDDSEEEEPETITKLEQRTMTIQVGNLNDSNIYYVRVNDSSEVRGITQTALDTFLNGKAFDYWSLAVSYVSTTELDHLDVTYNGVTYTLKKISVEETETTTNEDGEEEETTSTVTKYYVDDTEVDTLPFTEFYSAAASMTCQSRLQEYKEDGEAELVLHYYNTDGEELKVAYIERDANFYTVTDSNGNFGLVNKMNVKELIEAFTDLLNE